MSAQGKCPCIVKGKDGSFDHTEIVAEFRHVLGGSFVACANHVDGYGNNFEGWTRFELGHSAPPAEPATRELGLSENLMVIPEAQVASPQEARDESEHTRAKEFIAAKVGDFFYPEQFDYDDWADILAAYAAHEHKLRVEAEQERDKLKTLTIAGQFKTLATEHELRLDAESKLAAAEARLAQIEQERSK